MMEEILINILSRLPVKSLIRFHCVSKFWKTLIGESYLKKKHLNHAKNQPSSQKLLFFDNDREDYFWSCSISLVMEHISMSDFTSHSNPLEIVDLELFSSCDGLFLIGIWTDRFVEQPSILVLWNPSTRQSIRLAHTKFSEFSEVEDDEDRGSNYGLGYDSTCDDYKIFRIDISEKNCNEILALKNGSWRRVEGKTHSRVPVGREVILAFADGAFHWLGFLSKACVISFNISDEEYREISLPEMVSSEVTLSKLQSFEVDVDVYLGVLVLREMLGVYYKDDKNFNLWVMKKYGSWMKWLSIPSGGFYKIMPTYAFSDDQVLMCFCEHTWETPETVSSEYIFRMICGGSIFPEDYDIGGLGFGFPYMETLIFPEFGH